MVRGLLIVFCCSLLHLPLALAAEYPVIQPYQFYTASYETFQFNLVLEQESFVLIQKKLDTPPLVTTGIWRQTQGGATLQLANRLGFLCELQVGGTGNLYWSHKAGGESIPLVLTRQDGYPGTVCRPLVGSADIRNGKTIFHDDLSGLNFGLQGINDIENFVAAQYVKIEACSTLQQKCVLDLASWSICSRPKFLDSTVELFQDRIVAQVWRRQQAASGMDYQVLELRFAPLDWQSKSGAVNVFFNNKRIEAFYIFKEESLIFTEANSRAKELPALLRAPMTWGLNGNILTLTVSGEKSIELEKMP